MRIETAMRMAAAVMTLVLPGQAVAVEFVPVGPRAAGMGGAGGAVTTDTYASYWNPARLAIVNSLAVPIHVTAQVIGTNGMINAVDNLKDFNPNDTSPHNLVNAQNIANQLNRPRSSVSGLASGGFYVKGHFGEHAFGFNISDGTTSGGFVSSPLRVSQTPPGTGPITISGAMALRGLEARQAAFSY